MSDDVAAELFVYGSLKRGFRHHDELRGATFQGETETEVGYHLVLLGEYPALIEGGADTVRGERYAVNEALLARLDEFEGSGYERRTVKLATGSVAQAYFASSPAEGLPRLPDNVWARR